MVGTPSPKYKGKAIPSREDEGSERSQVSERRAGLYVGGFRLRGLECRHVGVQLKISVLKLMVGNLRFKLGVRVIISRFQNLHHQNAKEFCSPLNWQDVKPLTLDHLSPNHSTLKPDP